MESSPGRARQKGYRRAIMAIAGGSAGGQLLSFAAIPILSRLYDPTAFGELAVITAAGTIVSVPLSLRLERAIPVPAKDQDALQIARTALASIVIATPALLSLSVIFRVQISEVLGISDLKDWAWVIPLVGALVSTLAVATQFAIRGKKYGAIGYRNTLQPGATALAQLALSPVVALPGLVVGMTIGRLVGTFGLLRKSGLTFERLSIGGIRRGMNTLRRYRRFPILGVPAGVLNTLGLSLPPIVVASAFGATVGGQFGIANTIVALPVTLVGNAVGQVFLGEFTRKRHEDPAGARKIFTAYSKRLAVVDVALLFGLYLAAESLFPFVLGAQWKFSGEIAAVMALMVCVRLLASPVAMILAVLERQGLQLVLDSARVLIIVTVFWVARVLAWEPLPTIAIYTSGIALVYALQWVACWRSVIAECGNADPASNPPDPETSN